MSNVNKILNDVATRLGLIEETAIVKKSDELLRVLLSKPAVPKLGDFAKAVLCLDLACTIIGIGFDKETALTLSGLKKPTYLKSLHMLEKVLELDKPLSISEVCVQLSCTVIKELSQQILTLYKQHHVLAEITHPQYVAVAIYTACKLKSIKVQKSQFIAISRLKPMQWKELEAEFLKFAEKLGLNVLKTQKKTSRNELHEFLEEHANRQDDIQIVTKTSVESEIEDYDEWKVRILTAAREALAEV